MDGKLSISEVEGNEPQNWIILHISDWSVWSVSYIFLGVRERGLVSYAPALGEVGHQPGISHSSPGGTGASRSTLKAQVKLDLSRYIIEQTFSRTGV